MAGETLWGIDLGGTKIEGAVVSAEGKPLCRIRVPTEQAGGYEHILGRISSLVEQMEQTVGSKRPGAIGLSMPGSLSPRTGLVKNANTTCLIGRTLDTDLSRLLSSRVMVANDANCFALAEARLGAGKGAGVLFGVILGTGVGGGLVIGDSIWPGHHRIAGEWGHNVLDPDGEPCYCGKRGCVETVISGPATERHYRRLTGKDKSLKEIALEEDDAARETIDRLCLMFGRALSVVVNILDPDVIVVGGGVGNVKRLYSDGRSALGKAVFNDGFDARLVAPELGDSAGVFGACMLTR